jgi:hypothetical protein
MTATRWRQFLVAPAFAVLALSVATTIGLAGQAPAPTKAPPSQPTREQADDTAAFKDFGIRVEAYVKLQKTADATLPALKPTDVPELIAAHQQALARKIREARPNAKAGDLFTAAAIEAFRHASRPLEGPKAAGSRAYMQSDGPNPVMHLAVNGIYPDTEPITPLSPALLAAFPPLPPEVAYRIVDRTLLVVDLKSRLIVDFAREILPKA